MKLAILGFPIAHSRSPRMHLAALKAVGLGDWTYEAIAVPPDRLGEAIGALRRPEWRGANVTIPHKQAAFVLMDATVGAAGSIAAVNTIVVERGALIGHNTDAPGFLDAIGDVAGLSCAILGAGGSARAVGYALRQGRAREIRVVARRGGTHPWSDEALVGCDLVIGCTPPDAVPPALPDGARVVDLVYYETSVLAAAARARGLAYQDGLEILIRQGARSFELWTGRPAPLDVMREAVRDAEDPQLEPS